MSKFSELLKVFAKPIGQNLPNDSNDDFIVRFELEKYYRRRDRAVIAEQELTTFAPKVLLADTFFYKNMISYIMNGIDTQISEISIGNDYPCQILYPCFRNKKDVLRKDKEDYEYKKEREFCEDIVIQEDQINDLHDNIDLQSRMARVICKYLPLGPFPHVMHKAAPEVRVRL